MFKSSIILPPPTQNSLWSYDSTLINGAATRQSEPASAGGAHPNALPPVHQIYSGAGPSLGPSAQSYAQHTPPLPPIQYNISSVPQPVPHPHAHAHPQSAIRALDAIQHRPFPAGASASLRSVATPLASPAPEDSPAGPAPSGPASSTASPSAAVAAQPAPGSKQRKKKQCSECGNFYSNLTTHMTVHLDDPERPYRCSVCGSGFSRSNDLHRHSKRHWRENGQIQGAFKCPFSAVLLQDKLAVDSSDSRVKDLMINSTPCHSSGVFSRCDTYKNHLKALHFEYPPGTRKKQRHAVPGHCKLCKKKFSTVDEWLNLHVETGDCGYSF